MSSKQRQHFKELEYTNTRLRQGTAAARRETLFYKQIIEGAHDGLWHYETETGNLWISPSWWRKLGYSSETTPRNINAMLTFVHPADVDLIRAAFTSQAEGHTSEHACEFRMRTSCGENRTMRSYGTLLASPGTQECIVGTFADVTELRKQDEESQRFFRMFELIFQSIPHLIGVKNSSGEFLFANPAMAKFYGANTPAEMIGKRDSDYNKKASQVDHSHRIQHETGVGRH